MSLVNKPVSTSAHSQDVSQRWIKMAKRNISLFTTTQEAMANGTLV
jgi:hypothetical protein